MCVYEECVIMPNFPMGSGNLNLCSWYLDFNPCLKSLQVLVPREAPISLFGLPSVCCQTSLYLRLAFKSLLQRVICLSVLSSVCLVFMPFQRQRLDSSSELIARTLLQPLSLWNILANIVHLYNLFLA